MSVATTLLLADPSDEEANRAAHQEDDEKALKCGDGGVTLNHGARSRRGD